MSPGHCPRLLLWLQEKGKARPWAKQVTEAESVLSLLIPHREALLLRAGSVCGSPYLTQVGSGLCISCR